jgi:Tfp pilus assembly protein PilV
MRICCSKKSNRGLTLVEVVMSTLFLGIMAGGILSSISYGFATMQLVRENQRATQIMLEKVETIRLYRWDQVLAPGFIPAAFSDVYDPQSVNHGITYSGTVTVTNVPFSKTYSSNMRQLTLNLRWTSGGRIDRERTLTTYVSKDGLQNYVY